MLYFFFFSSRRRHTRYWRDWSSDVCSSDLAGPPAEGRVQELVQLTAPSRGARVGGPVTLSAEVSDDLAEVVERVEFLVDGVVVGTATAAPYAITWDASTAPAGPVKITVRVVDTGGEVATSR